MKNKRIFWVALVSAGVILLLLGACSILGLVIGSATHRSYTIERRVPEYKLDSLHRGAAISVFNNGKVTQGSFSAVKTSDSVGVQTRVLVMDRYLSNGLAQRLNIPFSEIDSVLMQEKVKLHKGQQWTNGWEMVHIPRKAGIAVHKKDGTVVNGKFLKPEKVNPGTDKVYNQIKIMESGNSRVNHIPLSDISYVICTGNTTYAMKGFLIGLAGDVATVAIIGVALSNMDYGFNFTPTTSSENSCPYIYSSTGEQYRFEGEMLVGSLFKGAQRTDVMPLRYLRPDDGTCHLRIANEMNETEYIDQLSLLAVDHPAGTRVVPDGNGSLWALGATLAPRKATDLAGADATADVLGRDGQGWLSSPFGRNPDDPRDLRDGLVLEFDRPQGADTATLSLRLLNTAWTESLYDQFQALPGTGQEAWLNLMDRSPEARLALAAAMIREMMLHVSVWDGGGWRPAGFVWAVGVTAERDAALRIPLNGISENSGLKIRLDCLPGTWLVDCAGLDYHATAVTARNIPAARATDGSGRDVSALIGAVDGQYYEMPILYQYADIEFVAPQPRPGFEQSFLLQCTGYYRPRVPAEGEPQTELMERLVQEPGAFGRYALENLNRDVAVLRRAQE